MCVCIAVAVCGDAGCGKSTLIGVLVQGGLDNGAGLRRLEVFRCVNWLGVGSGGTAHSIVLAHSLFPSTSHKHEIENGRTSSISQQIMGFDVKGNVVNYASSLSFPTAAEIVRGSAKVINLIDLAGHKKYLKTTGTTCCSASQPQTCSPH